MSLRPRLLDLCCKADGAAMGYYRAGFDVVGVDIEKQLHYPFEFHQGDAMEWSFDGFDAVHASPPCKRFSALNNRFTHDPARHPDLVSPLRKRLQEWGGIYVIENVPGAPLINPLILCGTMFGLRLEGRGHLRRHRLFESNIRLLPERRCDHSYIQALGVFGHGASGFKAGTKERVGGIGLPADDARSIMQIDWMTRDEVAQAVPPVYTEFVGKQLITAVIQ